MEPLARLFGSALRVKIMRLFLFQEGEGYTVNEITVRTQSKIDNVKKELKLLESAGFVIYKDFGEGFEEVLPEDVVQKRTRNSSTRKTARLVGYAINTESALIRGLRELLVDSNLISTKDLQKHFAGFSYIKLLLLSGVFMKIDNVKADLLLVGEKIDMKRLMQTIKLIESEIGKEIRYSVFTPEEFLYRISMYDKYVLEILAAPHERIIQKMEIPKP
jgi:hypothetical protein